ncbi:MAG: hypothetical protein QOG65_3015 [Actinomycetota bacterium]|nr:hypothetical protein [Actinomycetota bacterium]
MELTLVGTYRRSLECEPRAPAAQIVLPDGFIWQKGECGVGSFSANAEGINLAFEDSNWIYYEFDWADDR